MVILQTSPENSKKRMKSYLKRVIYRPGGRKPDKNKRYSRRCGYLGDDERAQLKRTYSPPPRPRSRPFPLVFSHHSEEALNCIEPEIGSAGSSHSSGFNETMIEALEASGYRPFNADSPMISEYNYNMRDEEDKMRRSGSQHIFEGIGGINDSDNIDMKDQHQLIQALTHKNKILTQERRALEMQFEHQEDVLDKMEVDIKRMAREKKDLEKKRREEGGRMRTENKELEYSLDKLREQRAEAEHRLQLVDRERESTQIQLEEVWIQLAQALAEQAAQRDRHDELLKQLENKDRQLSSLADDFKQDSHLNMAAQMSLEEKERENQELKSHLEQVKIDRDTLAGNLTKVTCELSRIKLGVPMSPNSSTSSITSPIAIAHYHSLPPVFEEGEGENVGDLLANRSSCSSEALAEIEESELLGGYVNIAEIMQERAKLMERNDMLEAELRDMKDLMVVVAPQHYIDDEALALHTRVQYTRPVEMQYDRITYGDSIDPHSMLRITPNFERPPTPETALDREEPDNCRSPLIRPDSSPTCRSSQRSGSSESVPSSRDPSDDADSGVLCQSSTDLGEHICESCSLWHPERDMLVHKVVSTELHRDRLVYQLEHLQSGRCRNWFVQVAALAILLVLVVLSLPRISSHHCAARPISWADLFSYRIVHLRDRTYNIPH